jgi:excisionase family DNA binding protein
VANDLEQVYDIEHVAKALMVSTQTVRRMLNDGRLRGIKVSDKPASRWRIRAVDFWAYLDGSQVPAKSK